MCLRTIYHYRYVFIYIIALQICAYLHYIITYMCQPTFFMTDVASYISSLQIRDNLHKYHYRYVPTLYHYRYVLICIISLQICRYLHYIFADMCLLALYHYRYVPTYIISLQTCVYIHYNSTDMCLPIYMITHVCLPTLYH